MTDWGIKQTFKGQTMYLIVVTPMVAFWGPFALDAGRWDYQTAKVLREKFREEWRGHSGKITLVNLTRLLKPKVDA